MPAAHDPELTENLVIANRILYDPGVVDGFSHRTPADRRHLAGMPAGSRRSRFAR